jgi:hypothetical protein
MAGAKFRFDLTAGASIFRLSNIGASNLRQTLSQHTQTQNYRHEVNLLPLFFFSVQKPATESNFLARHDWIQGDC